MVEGRRRGCLGLSCSLPHRHKVSHVNDSVAPRSPSQGAQLPQAVGPPLSSSAHAQSLPPAWTGAVQQSALALALGAGPARAHARRDPRPPRRRRRSRRLRRGSRSPSRSPSASPEPREGETLSPGMQREQGFNTKMADGPDEYDTEAGCVPLLHPEVRSRAERIPHPKARGPFSPGLAEGGGVRVRGSGTCRSWGGRGGKSRPERGCERITGEEIAGRARPGRALDAVPACASKTEAMLIVLLCRRTTRGCTGC